MKWRFFINILVYIGDYHININKYQQTHKLQFTLFCILYALDIGYNVIEYNRVIIELMSSGL